MSFCVWAFLDASCDSLPEVESSSRLRLRSTPFGDECRGSGIEGGVRVPLVVAIVLDTIPGRTGERDNPATPASTKGPPKCADFNDASTSTIVHGRVMLESQVDATGIGSGQNERKEEVSRAMISRCEFACETGQEATADAN